MRRLTNNIKKLSERCIEYNVAASKELMKEVSETMLAYFHKHEEVQFLTSNQFSYDCRVVGIRFEDGIKFFVNPMFMKQEGIHCSIENDICLPDRTFLVARHTNVTVAFQDLFGLASSIDLDGTVSDIMQHCVQLLDGILICDIGFEVFDDFLEASDEDQAEVIKLYMDSIKTNAEVLNDDIKNDPEANKIAKAIDFITAAAKGEVEIEPRPISKKKQRVLEKLAKKLKAAGQNYTKKKKKKRK